jgi:RimJ/RimL family protein N-acetyltransferase
MIEQPILETQRFHLRPLEQADVPAIQKAAGAREIADTMISIPHPYPEQEAERYVSRQQAERRAGRSVTFGIVFKSDGLLCGLIEVRDINREHSWAELSFWLVPEVWGKGCMSEILQAVVQYAFEGLGLNRLYAYHMVRNPASGRVLEKNGFKREGFLRQCVRKWGRYEDVSLWAILREDWLDRLLEQRKRE